jgi:hypothetical protein
MARTLANRKNTRKNKKTRKNTSVSYSQKGCSHNKMRKCNKCKNKKQNGGGDYGFMQNLVNLGQNVGSSFTGVWNGINTLPQPEVSPWIPKLSNFKSVV